MKRFTLFTTALLFSLSASACKKKDEAKEEPPKTEEVGNAEMPAEPVAEPEEAAEEESKDIVDTAVAAGNFTKLAAALQAAELVDTLKGDGPFTVFAPTDEAFAKIPQADLEALLADKEKLTKVLTHHVVAGKVMASDVAGMSSAKTVNGTELSIQAEDGVKIGEATVTTADIETSNGVIHVIDTVLMPAE